MSVINSSVAKANSRAAQIGSSSALIMSVNHAIEQASKEGYEACTLSVEGQPRATVLAVMEELKRAGYNARWDTGDQREPANELYISW